MYYIVEIDGKVRNTIDKQGKPNKYGEPKLFSTKEEADNWILKKSYKGMSHHYEVKGCMTK